MEKTIEVCAHQVNINWWHPTLLAVPEVMVERLTEAAEEISKECIIDGWVSGELNFEDGENSLNSYMGWWEIQR